MSYELNIPSYILSVSDDYSSDGYLDEFARIDHQHPLSNSLKSKIVDRVVDFSSLPAASSHKNELWTLTSTGEGYWSDGTSWVKVFPSAGGGGGAPTTASYLTLGLDGTLTNERTLAVEPTVLSLTDGGANNNATVAVLANGITNAKLAQAPTLTLKGNNTGGTANIIDLTVAQIKTMLAYVSTDISNFSEAVDDRVAALLVNSASVTWTYDDVLNTLSATAVGGGGGSAVIKTATINVVGNAVQRAIVNVVDATVSAISKLMVTWGSFSDLDENTSEMDDIVISTVPKAGSFDLVLSTNNDSSFFRGVFKFNYLIG